MSEKLKKALLDDLYQLTLIEEERPLTEEESKNYLMIVNFCQEHDIEIDFGIVV